MAASDHDQAAGARMPLPRQCDRRPGTAVNATRVAIGQARNSSGAPTARATRYVAISIA